MLAGLSLAGAANAQSTEPVCTPGATHATVYGAPNMPHAAFSATIKNSFEQTLPDGNHIRGFTRTQQARDDAGRTMRQMPVRCHLDEDGVPQLDILVTVFDPATSTTLRWETGADARKVVRAFHAQTPSPASVGIPAPAPLTQEQLAARKLAAAHRNTAPGRNTEDLGDRTIVGVEAHGTRLTRTIAAGEEGNQLPVVTTRETWNSDDLRLTLMSINDDPRTGRTTIEVEDFSRTEPDPSLFAPPEGYTVEDATRPATTP